MCVSCKWYVHLVEAFLGLFVWRAASRPDLHWQKFHSFHFRPRYRYAISSFILFRERTVPAISVAAVAYCKQGGDRSNVPATFIVCFVAVCDRCVVKSFYFFIAGVSRWNDTVVITSQHYSSLQAKEKAKQERKTGTLRERIFSSSRLEYLVVLSCLNRLWSSN